MPDIKAENADEAAIEHFYEAHEVFRRQFEEYQRVGEHQAAPVIFDGDEDDVSESLKQEINDDVERNFDVAPGLHNAHDIDRANALGPNSEQGRTSRRNQRNGPIDADEAKPFHYIQRLDDVVAPGDIVEIKKHRDLQYNFRFLQVRAIYTSELGVVCLRGIPYTRTRNTLCMLEYKRNELVEIWDIDNNDKRDWEEQAQVQIVEADITKKRNLVVTNTQWPDHACNYRDYGTKSTADQEGVMVCRWRMITQYRDAGTRRSLRPFSRTLYHLAAEDVTDNTFRGDENQKLLRWRGTKTRGGSHNPGRPSHGVVDVEVNDKQELQIDGEQKYTFGDMFCGAGGASRGALSADVHISLACDLDGPSCASYRMNFPGADLKEVNISDLLMRLRNHEVRVDILHISPPCQYYSPAHTNPGKDDERNRAILLATREIVHKIRPRIVTVEQTFGILRQQHMRDFHLLLNCFTANGYSVTWKFVRLTEWGVPQPRKRVIMVASCPGEVHPQLPGPSGVEASVNMFLAQIDPNDTHHNPEMLLNNPNFPKEPWNGDTILRHTITTGAHSPYNYHPSGLRPFTVREFASLQTFPPEHHFVEQATQAKKQIGNAFPPVAVQYLYEHLLEHLRTVDGVEEMEAMDVDNNGDIDGDGDSDDDDVVWLGSRNVSRG